MALTSGSGPGDPEGDQELTDLVLSFELPAPIPDAELASEPADPNGPPKPPEPPDRVSDPVQSVAPDPAPRRHWWSRG